MNVRNSPFKFQFRFAIWLYFPPFLSWLPRLSFLLLHPPLAPLLHRPTSTSSSIDAAILMWATVFG